MPKTSAYRQFTLYVLIGGIGYGVDVSVFFMARHYLALGLAASNVASRGLGAVVTFLGNRLLTFPDADGGAPAFAAQSLRYLALWLAATAVSTAALAAAVSMYATPAGEVGWKIAVEAGITVANFLISRCWVFRRRKAR